MIKVKEKNTLVCVVREKIVGDHDAILISISVVENYNNKIRQRSSGLEEKRHHFRKIFENSIVKHFSIRP